MNERRRLPDCRVGITFDFQHQYPGAYPMTFTATTGHYPAEDPTQLGEVGEVFVDLVNGTDRRVNVDVHDATVVLSIALQYGAPLSVIAKACLRGEDGRAHGFMGSLLDAVMEGAKS